MCAKLIVKLGVAAGAIVSLGRVGDCNQTDAASVSMTECVWQERVRSKRSSENNDSVRLWLVIVAGHILQSGSELWFTSVRALR